MKTSPYYKKIITFPFQKKELKFAVSQELFSSHQVDIGTQRLLRTLIFENINEFNKVLDLGCGYGPIGITLKNINPEAAVQMTDRDALALKYAQHNVELNNEENNVSVYGSLGYDNVKDTDFDLIVSNIPAKIGEEALSHFIHDAKHFLIPEGRVIIVVIDVIVDFVKEQLSDESITVLYEHSWPGHTVFHYNFTPEAIIRADPDPGFERGIYDRGQNTFSFKNEQFNIQTSFHLPEFSEMSFDTALLLKKLEKLSATYSRPLIFNPSQGYIPISVVQNEKVKEIYLVDKNLQALMVSRDNLIKNGFSEEKINTFHQVGLQPSNMSTDAIFGFLPEQQNMAVYEMIITGAEQALAGGSFAMFVSSSTVITRLIDIVGRNTDLVVVDREREKGRSVVVLDK